MGSYTKSATRFINFPKLVEAAQVLGKLAHLTKTQ